MKAGLKKGLTGDDLDSYVDIFIYSFRSTALVEFLSGEVSLETVIDRSDMTEAEFRQFARAHGIDSKANITLQAGAMQWMLGNVNATTGVKGVGDLFGKALRGSVTGESAIKPEYTGDGILVLEPTYKHLILLDIAEWNGSVVLDDGLFLACDSKLKHKAVMRSNFSSAVAGGEGLFNLGIIGNSGVICLESDVPKEELVTIELHDDIVKIDGNYAIAWSGSLNFAVERSGKSLIGSAASGEGLVNVYRGTGKVMMAPVRDDPV